LKIAPAMTLTVFLISGIGTALSAQENLVITGGVGPLALPATGMRAQLMQADGGEARLALAMDGESGLRFATFTSLSLGQSVMLSLCGHAILHTTVQAQIDSGYVVSAPLEAALAQELADVINHGRSCAD
jgi:hypothetical protein